MIITSAERRLCITLQNLPSQHGYRYDHEAALNLQSTLFKSLTAYNEDYLRTLFTGKLPEYPAPWSLREAQGMTEEMEYTEAARGKACGHIFKSGDSCYRCKTCSDDDTCVLCTRCFEASDHTGHIVSQSISMGNTGCCDCGDAEAWRIPVECAIHTADSSHAAQKRVQAARIPEDLLQSVKMTIGRAMDYLIDVISCSPENLRLEKTEKSIREDEEQARFNSAWYTDPEEPKTEFALMLWNDEKHTVPEVEKQIARACKKKMAYGKEKANEINDTGRSVIEYSDDIPRLLKIAEIIEQIKLTVTIRSSRDAFREQMCGTIIEWLSDIAGCSLGDNNELLRNTICEELLKVWRMGSVASNKWIGKDGLDDHEIDEAVELGGLMLAPQERRGTVFGRIRVIHIDNDSDENSNDNDNDNDNDDEDEDEDTESRSRDPFLPEDPMDLDMTDAGTQDSNERLLGIDLEDETEVSEATLAGYPPPPPPPPAPSILQRPAVGSVGSIDPSEAETFGNGTSSMRANIAIPVTPIRAKKKATPRPPAYWLDRTDSGDTAAEVSLHEDLSKRIRLDWLLLYDLRLWKEIRIALRDLYISTVVTVPEFKRILGMRFAGLYGVLAQLYLIADREPDHSIVNLSTQLFTTPSVTQEIVERGNFITTLFSILYTFLTKRTVQHPWQVGVDDALNFEHGAVANRRMYHFFVDLKHILGVGFVRSEIRTQDRYVLQFLDLVRLPQGICPNVRAVGEHVEYESDTWIAAQLLTKEINRICRQFAETFDARNGGEEADLARAIRNVAKATIINSLGVERLRFDQAELKAETAFQILPPFHFENNGDTIETRHKVVEFAVEKEPISFHHALHYTLSWLIDFGRAMSSDHLKTLLNFTIDELSLPPPVRHAKVPEHDPQDYLMALFDFPLRVCAWLAQMKAGLWVRNGISLRHQMTTYRGVSHRDLAHHRDIVLLQTALVICDPARVLAQMIDRFAMTDWMQGHYQAKDGFELGQQFDIAEDFVHLIIVLLSDRISLRLPDSEQDSHGPAIRRDIIQILCFKPLSFSELSNRFADKAIDLEAFQDILEDMTTYKPPEGLADTGSFELKRENFEDVDPYTAHYTKNQRDEAENAHRKYIAEKTGKPIADIVYEPRLSPIEFGLFQNLSAITRTPIFSQVIFYALASAFEPRFLETLAMTRIESFIQVVLHLMLIAISEETSFAEDMEMEDDTPSFIKHVLQKRSTLGHTVLDLLIKTLENNDLKACHAKIRLALRRMKQKRPILYHHALEAIYADSKNHPTLSMDNLGFETPRTPNDDDEEARQSQARQLKKQQALDRQAKVMAQMQQQQRHFMENQSKDQLDEDDFEDWETCSDQHMEEQSKTWRYPSGNCILCQEETNDARLYGTFALITNYPLFRQTYTEDSDFLGEVLSTPTSLDQSAQHIRPFGLAGANQSLVTKKATDGHLFTSEHYGIGKGFPPSSTERAPISTGCGHIMHFSCFTTYCNATKRRQEHQIARKHPENMKLKEFVCPLCKALGNTFLPLIWKGKDESYPGVLNTEMSFDEWVSAGAGLQISRYRQSQDGRTQADQRLDVFASYASKSIIPALSGPLSNISSTPLSSPISPTYPRLSLHSWPALSPHGPAALRSPTRSTSLELPSITELVSAYRRLRDTVTLNKIPSRDSSALPPQVEELSSSDSLATTLGHSITAAEIAQRGVQIEEGKTLLDKVPRSLLTHLRILSETVSSYISVGALDKGGKGNLGSNFFNTAHRQLLQLFAGHAQISEHLPNFVAAGNPLPALSIDPFILLTECSVYLVPSVGLDVTHILRLCYLLELVRTALRLTSVSDKLDELRKKLNVLEICDTAPENLEALHSFVVNIADFSTPQWPLMEYQLGPQGQYLQHPYSNAPDLYRLLHRAMSTYALTFLRKATILLNVKYGMDCPETEPAAQSRSELSRLTKLLQLPSLPEMFASVGQPNLSGTGKNALAETVQGWLDHWRYYHRHAQMLAQPRSLPEYHDILRKSAIDTIRLSHPAIFELIGLPKYFDTLTYEATRRRCPTKNTKMEDPTICLFCGDIFCGQALCCSKDGSTGGATRHMEK